jgi:mRNA interferase MazF
MKRGDVWWVNFEPSVGSEIRKARPAVIVSNNSANRYLNRVQVVPLTSSTGKCYPSEAVVELNGLENKAMADQIATVDKKRFTKKAGEMSINDMKQIEHAIKIQLGLPL